MGQLLGRYGSYRGISRSALVDMLGAANATTVAFGTTVQALRQDDHAAHVLLCSPDELLAAPFDLVVVADGLHSHTRELVLDPQQVSTFDSGWGGWVAWAPADGTEDLVEEMWGPGCFVGSYPVLDGLGVFIGGPRESTRAGTTEFLTRIRDAVRVLEPRTETALRSVDHDAEPYFWPLTDGRSHTWAVNRCVLLGDAAAGFLPTAGIGAGMAIESAHVLASCLHTVPRSGIPNALQVFQRRQQPRVFAAQTNSRQLARLMFCRGTAIAAVRDTDARFVSLDATLRPIIKLLRDRPNQFIPTGQQRRQS